MVSNQTGSDEIGRSGLNEGITEILRTLCERDRIAIEMTYFEGPSEQQVAARLGQPLATVKRRIRDVLTPLRDAVRAERR